MSERLGLDAWRANHPSLTSSAHRCDPISPALSPPARPRPRPRPYRPAVLYNARPRPRRRRLSLPSTVCCLLRQPANTPSAPYSRYSPRAFLITHTRNATPSPRSSDEPLLSDVAASVSQHPHPPAHFALVPPRAWPISRSAILFIYSSTLSTPFLILNSDPCP